MTSHLLSMLVGLAVGVLGLVLWLTTGDVDTPVVTPTKVGVVLMVLGGAEVVWSAVALMLSRSQHDEPRRSAT